MADLTITAANVVAQSAASRQSGTAGEAITAGQAVVKDPTSKKLVRADSNHATVALRNAEGVALNGAALDQPLMIAAHGPVTMGATLTPGATYFLSDTPGGICPDADVGAGENVCQIGIASSASVLVLDIQTPGVTR